MSANPYVSVEQVKHDRDIRNQIEAITMAERAGWAEVVKAERASPRGPARELHNVQRGEWDRQKGELLARLHCRDVSVYLDALHRYASHPDMQEK